VRANLEVVDDALDTLAKRAETETTLGTEGKELFALRHLSVDLLDGLVHLLERLLHAAKRLLFLQAND